MSDKIKKIRIKKSKQDNTGIISKPTRIGRFNESATECQQKSANTRATSLSQLNTDNTDALTPPERIVRSLSSDLELYQKLFPDESQTPTLITVVKHLTASQTFEEPTNFPDDFDQTFRKGGRCATLPSRKRSSQVSDRGSVLSVSVSSQPGASDSGYETTGQTSGSTSYHSLHDTSAQEVQVKDELVSTLLENIASLAEHTRTDGECEYARVNIGNEAKESFPFQNLKLRRSYEHREVKPSASPSPQSSPATPRRFKSPDCLRTRGMDFEEKWCYFEAITSPPEQFQDLSLLSDSWTEGLIPPAQTTESIAAEPHSEIWTEGSIPTLPTTKCITLNPHTKTPAEGATLSNPNITGMIPQPPVPSEAKLAAPRVDINQNIILADDPSAISHISSLNSVRRTVRKVHREKQNAETNTESTTPSPIETPPPPIEEMGRKARFKAMYGFTAGQSVKHNNHTPENMEKPVGKTPPESSIGLPSGRNTKKTSPILKRLFSTTMARGLQVCFYVVTIC